MNQDRMNKQGVQAIAVYSNVTYFYTSKNGLS